MCQAWKEGYLYVLFAFFKLSFFTNSIMCLRQITECQGCYDLGHFTALCYAVKSSPAETENGSPCCPFVSEAAFQFGKEILFPPMSSPPRFKRFASPKTKNKPTVGRPQKFQKTLNENSSCEWNGFANCTGCLGFWQEYSKICCSRIWREQQKEKGKLWPSAGPQPAWSPCSQCTPPRPQSLFGWDWGSSGSKANMKQWTKAAPVSLNLTVCYPGTGIIWCLICRASYGIWLWSPGELRLLFRHTRNVCVIPQMGQQTAVGARSLMEWILDANQIFKWMYSVSGRTIPVVLQTCFYIKFWLL